MWARSPGVAAPVPDSPPGARRQQAEAGTLKVPGAPDLARRVYSVYDVLPIGALPLYITSSQQGTVAGVIAAGTTVYSTAPGVQGFLVPQGRIAIIRGFAYDLQPLPAPSGLDASVFFFDLLRNGDAYPYEASIQWPPWWGELELFAIFGEGDRIDFRATWISTNAEGNPFMDFAAKGELLRATGEPLEQMVGHLLGVPQ